MDNDPAGKSNTLSTGEANVSGSNSNGTSVDSTTPKLKLTFKLSEIRAASPAATSSISNTSLPSEEAPSKKRRNARKKKLEERGATDSSFATPHKKRQAKDNVIILPPTNSHLPHHTAISDPPPKERASSRIQFPEQIEFVREIRKFRVRKWRAEPAVLTLLGGRTLNLPCWVRDKAAGNMKGQKKAFSPTFVCTHEGCHKIFDAKDKWRRHQNIHKKKEKRKAEAEAIATSTTTSGLQLKLNMGIIKKATNNTSTLSVDAETSSLRSSSPLNVSASSELELDISSVS